MEGCTEQAAASEGARSNKRSRGGSPCSHGLTIKRAERQNLEEVYDCRYKINLHRKKEITENAKYVQDIIIPTNDQSAGGILLIIILQWDMFDSDNCATLTGHTRTRAFLIPSENVEAALKDVISPLLSALGIISPEENEAMASQLVSDIASLHHKEINNTNVGSDDPSKWMPMVLEIVPEITDGKFEWVREEARRFLRGLQLMKRSKKNIAGDEDDEEEGCCCICLENIRFDLEFVGMPYCPHIYHEHCILQWMKKPPYNCPLCRTPVISPTRSKWKPIKNPSCYLKLV